MSRPATLIVSVIVKSIKGHVFRLMRILYFVALPPRIRSIKRRKIKILVSIRLFEHPQGAQLDYCLWDNSRLRKDLRNPESTTRLSPRFGIKEEVGVEGGWICTMEEG